MNDKNDNDISLELDADEAHHLQCVPEKYINLLTLTNEGALICDNISAEVCKDLPESDPKIILSMLVLKIAEQTEVTPKS